MAADARRTASAYQASRAAAPARGQRGRLGFSLIEVLAAVFLTAILMGVAVSFQIQLGDAISSTRDRIRIQRQAVAVLDRVARDLEATYLIVKPENRDPLDHPWVFVGQKLSGGQNADAVKFVTRNFRSTTVDGPASDLAVVAYYVRRTPDGPGFQLMRQLSPRLPDTLDREFPADDDETADLVAENLESFSISFIDEEGSEASEWDSSQLEQSGMLPLAVRIGITMRSSPSDTDGDESEEEFADDEREETDEDEASSGEAFERLVVLPMRPVSFKALDEFANEGNKAFAEYLPEDAVLAEEDEAGDDDDEASDATCYTIADCVADNADLLEAAGLDPQQVYQQVPASDCVKDNLDKYELVRVYCQ